MAFNGGFGFTPNGSAGGGGGGGTTITQGTAVLDFGAAPGSSFATVDVSGQAGFTASSFAQAWIMGATTATHNEYEHMIAPIMLRVGNQTTGAFTVYASTELRLDGTFEVAWMWSN